MGLQMNEIIPLENANPTELFAPGGLTQIIERIESDARSITPDVSTAKGRKEIASLAAKVARSKTYLDGIGKDYVSRLKAMPRQVDAERKAMRDRLDQLRDSVRAPLTEFEEAEKQRVGKITSRIARWSEQEDVDIREFIKKLEAVQIDDSFEEFAAAAAKAKDAALAQARRTLAEIEAAEERARIEAERAEQERIEREERIARQAADRARREAEEDAMRRAQAAALQAETERQQQEIAKLQAEQRAAEAERRQKEAERAAEAERTRVEMEQRRRQEDEENRRVVHACIAADLRQHVVSYAAAQDLVELIAAGKIESLKIIY